MLQIIKPGPAQTAVRHVKSGGRYDVAWNIQTRGKTQYRSGILGNIWLIERKAHDLGFSAFIPDTTALELRRFVHSHKLDMASRKMPYVPERIIEAFSTAFYR